MAAGVKRGELCIFDLDGTLVDSLRDIAEAVNECLELLSLPTHPAEHYRFLVGEGVPTLCQRAIGQTHPHLLQRLIELARPRYRTRVLRHTRPYAGIDRMLQELGRRGYKLAVLSNKPHDMTVRVVRAFWPDNTFARIQGYESEEQRKPNPHFVADIARECAIEPCAIWMIGDTPTDIHTARQGGARSIGVTWGFRERADLEAAGADFLVDQPLQIVDLLERARTA